jgi:two-component system phosphate regulon sensor histidine kinase PhoR
MDGDQRSVKPPRSIFSHAWSVLAAQAVLTAGVVSFVLAGAAQHAILGLGLAWTSAILAAGLVLPLVAVALGLRWVSGPLRAAMAMARRRAHGDLSARIVPGGPADVRELAISMNQLSDSSDQLRADDQERARLQAAARQASIRIREHLRGDAIVREAVNSIHEHLAVDLVWVGLVSGDRLTFADGDPGGGNRGGDPGGMGGRFLPGAVGWIQDIYRHRSSYRVQDLTAAQPGEIPAEIKKILLSQGATSLLLTPFGAGQELLGCLTLLRTGTRRWIQPEIEAVESLAGDIGRALEHARLYEAEERLVTELKSLDHARSAFLASASHDLRTPLTSILGYIEMLADGEAGVVSPEHARMLDAVDRNVRRLKTMIEDMLTTSKIELGAFTSRLHPVDLIKLMAAAGDVIRPSAQASGLSFAVDCGDHQLAVAGDAEQLDRMMINLLSNAVKYTPRGGAVNVTMSRDGDAAVLAVADTGIGIPEKDQDSLFTRFYRASNAIDSAIPGSGLGLSIVRTIVANHHGYLTVESAEGRGTTVTVRIPLLGTALPGQSSPVTAGHRDDRSPRDR